MFRFPPVRVDNRAQAITSNLKCKSCGTSTVNVYCDTEQAFYCEKHDKQAHREEIGYSGTKQRYGSGINEDKSHQRVTFDPNYLAESPVEQAMYTDNCFKH